MTGRSALTCLIVTLSTAIILPDVLAQHIAEGGAGLYFGNTSGLNGPVLFVRHLKPTGLGRERKSFLTSTGIDGLAGSRLFHGGRLILDYYRHRAIVEPAAGVGRDCRYDQSGLTLTARGADYRDFRVGYVVPHSPAAEVGIQEGDRILAIDGRSSAEVELSDLRRALAVDSAARQLRLLRGADTLVVTVKLRRLF